MSVKLNTVVIFLQTETWNGHSKHLNSLLEFVKKIDGVSRVWYTNGDISNADMWADKIRQNRIERIVLAGLRPGAFKPVFTRAMHMAGEEAANVLQAGFSADADNGMAFITKAKASLLSVLKDVPIDELYVRSNKLVSKETLVIGAGIAGIQASLEIADGHQKVYLLEKTATIGGHMAMFDKTFPTLDCAACILTPKMVEVGQHTNIEILTYSEIVDLKGVPGDYTVKILKRARRVNLSTCIGCGNCAEKCPKKVPSEFDAFTTMRKVIYIPFPQAVPNKYLIDEANCIYVENGKCGVCAKVCPVPDCINLDEKDETIEIKVGNILVATGFKAFDPTSLEQYGYGTYPNVLTSLELERLVNASGPTGGNISFRTQDKKGNWVFVDDPQAVKPKSFALIHCIGSRDKNQNKYCSKVCCMYSLKLAHLLKEKMPEADIFEYYIDMRAFGKGYEEFYERIREEGVKIIRGRTARIAEKGEKLILRSEDILADRLIEQEVDMVILSVGLEPRDDAKDLAAMLSIETDTYGWFNEADYNTEPTSTENPGISIAGVCQGPKDIPDSVSQASAAASRVISSIIKERINEGIAAMDPEEADSILNSLIKRED